MGSKLRKLSFKERHELDSLPEQIEILENEQSSIQSRLGDPSLYQNQGEEVPALNARLTEIEDVLSTLYARWEELETIRSEQE